MVRIRATDSGDARKQGREMAKERGMVLDKVKMVEKREGFTDVYELTFRKRKKPGKKPMPDYSKITSWIGTVKP